MFELFRHRQAEWIRAGARFVADRKGSVAPMAGITALMVFTTVGGAVDLGQAYVAKTRLQSAVDTAALATASSFQHDASRNATAAIARGQQYFTTATQNVPGAAAQISIDTSNGTVIVEGEKTVKTPFLSVIGFRFVVVASRAEAAVSAMIGNGNEVEMALMLDVTGSMDGSSGSGGTKLQAMQNSAKNLIDILIPSSGTPHAKVALAPFSRTVNVGDAYISAVTGRPISVVRSGNTFHLKRCVTERTGTHALTDAAPGAGRWLPAYPNPADPYVDRRSDARDCSPNHIIMPLTTNKSLLKSHIDSFTADGYTAGALGTAWAWYLLSPNWSGVFTGASAPQPYGTANLRKIAVLLTDGTYNTRHGVPYSDGSSEAQSISQQAVNTCAAMKAAGIEIFTIGFRLNNDLARDTMRDCATDAAHAYLAEDAEELQTAFTQIAYRAVPLHLSR